MAPYYTNYEYITSSLESEFFPPEAFVYLDSKGFVQNDNGVPILYYNYRQANTKAVDSNLNQFDMRYSTSISEKDLKLAQNSNAKIFLFFLFLTQSTPLTEKDLNFFFFSRYKNNFFCNFCTDY